ncbi:hypothetical protein JHK87_049918 [Glycine soja]|nr:hypothetical protein JHK87_049918 [Glycine soja]
MGLYVVHDHCTQLVALGKVYDSASTIHNIPYVDDVIRVSVVKVYHGDAQVLFLALEIQFVSQAIGTFIGWPTHLVKPVCNEDSHKLLPKRVTSTGIDNAVVAIDPLGELVKNMFDVYQKPIQLPWDGAKIGIPNVKDGFFITHTDVIEIILGDKCLNISILQLWTMFMNDWSTSIGYGSLYGFLEPQSIHNAKDIRQECQEYIQTWVKESQQQRAMKTLTSTLEGKADQPVPRWLEPKVSLIEKLAEKSLYDVIPPYDQAKALGKTHIDVDRIAAGLRCGIEGFLLMYARWKKLERDMYNERKQ